MIAIDAGADDFEAVDSTLHIYSTPDKMEDIRGNLVEVGAVIKSSELSMLPKNTVSLDEKGGLKTLHLLDRLEELDDVQKVFSNADFPDETLERYRDES